MFKIEETLWTAVEEFVEKEYASAQAGNVHYFGCMDCSNSCAENCAAKCKKNTKQ